MRYLLLVCLTLAPMTALADPPYNPYPNPSCGFGSAAPVKGVAFICGNETIDVTYEQAYRFLHYGPVPFAPHARFCGFLFAGDRPGGKAYIELGDDPAVLYPGKHFSVVGKADGGQFQGSKMHQGVYLRWIDLNHSSSAAAARFQCEYGGYNGWHMHYFRKWS